MRKGLFYCIYFVITLVVTYIVQWLIYFFIVGLRFDAADYPPGDISVSLKLIFSTGIPIFYVVCMSLFSYAYYGILKKFNIQLHKVTLILYHCVVLILMVSYLNLIAFDFTNLGFYITKILMP